MEEDDSINSEIENSLSLLGREHINLTLYNSTTSLKQKEEEP